MKSPRRMTTHAATLGVCAWLAPGAAWAAAGGMSQVWEAVNLILLIGVLVYFARKPVLSFLHDRRAEIEGNLESSEKLLKDAEGRLEEWSQRAAQLDTEAQSIRDDARRAAEQERDAIIADARLTADRIRKSAGAVVDRELRIARERLRSEVADLATGLAARILAEQVTSEDRSRLVDEFVQKIEQGDSH